jgi:hypothetical protein
MGKPLKKRSDPLAPSDGPLMCASCDYQNQVRGQWKDDVFYPASEKCPKCETATDDHDPLCATLQPGPDLGPSTKPRNCGPSTKPRNCKRSETDDPNTGEDPCQRPE